jgi:hypothetical protein
MALIPEPPMSMESVMGCAARAAGEEARGAFAAAGAVLGFITTEF